MNEPEPAPSLSPLTTPVEGQWQPLGGCQTFSDFITEAAIHPDCFTATPKPSHA